jgi:DNA-binding transcriptional MerR regulator
MSRNIYLIRDLAYETGYSVDTLKFYLKKGLIREVSRGRKTNFRFFDDTTIAMLKIIRDLRKEGKTLGQIKARHIKNQKGIHELL